MTLAIAKFAVLNSAGTRLLHLCVVAPRRNGKAMPAGIKNMRSNPALPVRDILPGLHESIGYFVWNLFQKFYFDGFDIPEGLYLIPDFLPYIVGELVVGREIYLDMNNSLVYRDILYQLRTDQI